MIRVRAPDGVIVQFPDGTDPATMNKAMGQYHAQSLAARDAKAQTAGAGPFLAFMNGRTFNFAPEGMGAAAAFNTAIDNLGRTFTGQPKPYGAADMYHAAAQAARDEAKTYQAQHPGTNLALNIAGAGAHPVNNMAGDFVAGAKTLPAAIGRGAAVGGGTGAVYGAGEGGPDHRISGAVKGGVTGMVAGGAVPVATAGAGKAASVAADVGGNIKRAVGAADPQAVAQQRLAAALAKDVKAGVDPRAAAADWAGNSQPTLADVGGENVRAAVRDAGSQGPARTTLQQYRDTVGSNLQDNALAITRRLTPGETRSPQQLADALDTTRSTNAATNYAEPYAAPIDLHDRDVIQALRDPEGSQAINRAIAGARANMDYKAQADLEALKATAAGPTGDVQVWPTTGRALDRVQIAFGNRGQQLYQGGSRDIASGLFKRQALVNGLLDNVEGLSEARADYRNLSQQIDAIAHGQKVTNASPSVMADLLGGATPEAVGAAKVGARDALATAIGAPTEGAVGALNRLSTNTNTGQNMGLIFGPDATDAWRRGIQAEADRLSNANFMAPNTGSQTASKHQDLLAMLLHGGHAIAGIAKDVLGGGALNDAERSAMVNTSVGDLSPDLVNALLAAKAKAGLIPGVGYLTPALASQAATSVAQQ